MTGKKGECIGVRRLSMSRSKYIPLPDHPDTVKCAVCGKEKPTETMLNIGNGVFRCKKHRQSTVLKAGTIVPKNDMSTPCTHDDNVGKKTYKFNMTIQGTIEEV